MDESLKLLYEELDISKVVYWPPIEKIWYLDGRLYIAIRLKHCKLYWIDGQTERVGLMLDKRLLFLVIGLK